MYRSKPAKKSMTIGVLCFGRQRFYRILAVISLYTTNLSFAVRQARSQKFFWGDRHIKKILFGLPQVIDPYSSSGI